MKARLEFDLNDRDDSFAHFRSIKSTDMACVLFQIAYNLKKRVTRRLESDHQERSEFDGVDEVFSDIHDLFDEYDINIDELIE